ncbi:hypothetical protein V8B55DRAFT_1373480 [Mucor lusitanicus]|uniref:FAR1 domain-containing protein n=2 Tax=Mucor circinelloides f. lusitanicus TaxID=29924 RepID=A0A168KK95_MUCCL|nr:hypothetical protein FB192DRAFT_1432201 [Mucor lusitanicus]OAD02488.1 hypothetical protein MUCCIDRAFT_82878 [Mucor lusitanicus CBS 277.49]
MTKKSLQSAATSTALHGGNLTPQQQNEQALLLEPFYERLIGMTFDQSAIAIERCRDLCAEYGFTVKQEASTHRNIYVYCSREGLPDSLRNPKSNPQRKRPSKRCDCRWRVVLYENESSKWEFRKSLNPEAGKHNHELMRPDEIERSWPKEVTDLICELARLRMTTQDIRGRVRDQFPNIHWNERRFYNRLSEERQKIKLRDSIDRTHQLSDLWSKVCMATAGNDDLFQFVKQELVMLFQSICETVQIDPQTFPAPYIFRDDHDNDAASESSAMDPPHSHAYERPEARRSSSRSSITASTAAAAGKADSTLKGYITVEIPKQLYYIKIHNQRQLHETQLLKTQHRTRTLSEDRSAGEPLRKQARKGKGRQLTYNDAPDATMQHDSLPLMGHSSSPYPTHSQRPPAPPSSSSSSSSSMNPSRHQPQLQQQPATTFVYSYESNMGLDTSLAGYVNPPFQNNYTMAANSPSTPGFNAPDMSFTFDPQQHSPIGRNSADSSNSNANNNNNSSSNNEPTIHPALHSNPMSSHHHHHQQQQSHRGGSITPPNVQQQSSTPNAGNNSNQALYAMPPSGGKSQLGISPNAGVTTSMMSRSILPSVEQQQQQQSYHPQQQQGLFMRQSPPQQAPHHHHHSHHPHAMQQPPTPATSHHHHANPAGSMLPLYQQQQQQQHHHAQQQQQQQQHLPPPPSSEPRNSQ